MIITKTHVLYWQSRQVPSWVEDYFKTVPHYVGGLGPTKWNESVSISIHAAINDHVPCVVKPNREKERNQHNAINLLKMVRKNQTSYRICGRPDTLLAYLHNYDQQDGRLPIYRRWERKYAKKMLASVLATIT